MKFTPRKTRGRLTFEPLEDRHMLTGVALGIELVSIGAPGDQAAQIGNNNSTRAAISGDGRYVAFVSDANNLTPSDQNDARDVFVKDLHSGVLTLVSTASDGTQGNAGASPSHPSLSLDGRYVAFASRASNLVPQDRNGNTSDIFVKDLKTGRVTLASIPPNGDQIPGGSYSPALTPDGRYVAYVGGDGAYVKDLRTGELKLVAYGYFDSVSISADGRYVAYDNYFSVSVKDMQTEIITLASSAADGTPANGMAFSSQISANGRYVTFGSFASNLVDYDGNGHIADIFVKDLVTGDVQLVSDAQDGSPADDAAFVSSISDDGTWVVFSSDANNLLPDDGNLYGTDVYVRNLMTGELTRLTQDDTGTGSYFRPGISANGRHVTFDARNGDYVPGDVNGKYDVFSVDLHNGSAGDVRAEVVHDAELGDILVLTGDADDNAITLSSTDSGSILVEGGFGTTIDGIAASAVFSGIDAVRIDMGGGDDLVQATDLCICGGLHVSLGEGADTFEFQGGFLGTLAVDAAPGNDTVLLDSMTVLGESEIRLGTGDDVLFVVDSIFSADVITDGGLDEDLLSLLGDNTFLTRWLRIRFEQLE